MYQSHCQLLSKIPEDTLVDTWIAVCDAAPQGLITTAFLELFLEEHNLKAAKPSLATAAAAGTAHTDGDTTAASGASRRASRNVQQHRGGSSQAAPAFYDMGEQLLRQQNRDSLLAGASQTTACESDAVVAAAAAAASSVVASNAALAQADQHRRPAGLAPGTPGGLATPTATNSASSSRPPSATKRKRARQHQPPPSQLQSHLQPASDDSDDKDSRVAASRQHVAAVQEMHTTDASDSHDLPLSQSLSQDVGHDGHDDSGASHTHHALAHSDAHDDDDDGVTVTDDEGFGAPGRVSNSAAGSGEGTGSALHHKSSLFPATPRKGNATPLAGAAAAAATLSSPGFTSPSQFPATTTAYSARYTYETVQEATSSQSGSQPGSQSALSGAVITNLSGSAQKPVATPRMRRRFDDRAAVAVAAAAATALVVKAGGSASSISGGLQALQSAGHALTADRTPPKKRSKFLKSISSSSSIAAQQQQQLQQQQQQQARGTPSSALRYDRSHSSHSIIRDDDVHDDAHRNILSQNPLSPNHTSPLSNFALNDDLSMGTPLHSMAHRSTSYQHGFLSPQFSFGGSALSTASTQDPSLPFNESLVFELGKGVVLGQRFDIAAHSAEDMTLIEQQVWYGRVWCNLSSSRPFSTSIYNPHALPVEFGGLERLLQIVFTKFAKKEFVEGLFVIRAEFGADWFTPIMQHPFCILRHTTQMDALVAMTAAESARSSAASSSSTMAGAGMGMRADTHGHGGANGGKTPKAGTAAGHPGTLPHGSGPTPTFAKSSSRRARVNSGSHGIGGGSSFDSYVVFYLGTNVKEFCSIFRSVGLVPGINSWSAVMHPAAAAAAASTMTTLPAAALASDELLNVDSMDDAELGLATPRVSVGHGATVTPVDEDLMDAMQGVEDASSHGRHAHQAVSMTATATTNGRVAPLPTTPESVHMGSRSASASAGGACLPVRSVSLPGDTLAQASHVSKAEAAARERPSGRTSLTGDPLNEAASALCNIGRLLPADSGSGSGGGSAGGSATDPDAEGDGGDDGAPAVEAASRVAVSG
ncbi:hypothetical protein BC831DRAFT_445975 [Entophlyctis helioformis]|nr:hypothetical protein BC831DRAFT_445975 [Entophlyctis helioformis]